MKRPPDPTALLFGAYRRQILGLLLSRPGRACHVREIARQTGVPVGSLHRELRALADVGILRRRPAGRRVDYRANIDCPLFAPLAAIFGGQARDAANDVTPALRAAEPTAAYGAEPDSASRRQRLFDRLKVSQRPLTAFARRHHLRRLAFFGSATRDDFRPDSDIDVLVEFAPDHRRDPFARMDIGDELSAMFGGRNVDVVTPSVFRNPLRRASIERDLLTIHETR